VPVPGREAVQLVWLDGRDMKEEGVGQMALRTSVFTREGKVEGETLLDDRVCECCQTGLTWSGRGPLAVYRDRSEAEVRDIGVVRIEGTGWTKPALVNADGWKIQGCPVNGPQIDSAGASLVVAWFTAAEEKSRVQVKFSSDGGASYGNPLVVSEKKPLGRVDVVMLRPDLAAVSWMESVGEKAEIRLQLVSPSQLIGESQLVAETAAARKSGFPRMAKTDGGILIAWMDITGESRVRLSLLSIES
jgi:hypothetical protein